MMLVVGIIGAGPSGLCAARHVLETPGLTPVVWEQSAQLGGTWRLSEQVGKDSRGLPVHSSMYHSLRTDLPTVMMAYPDFPYPEDSESFVHHTTVLKYLEDYAQHHTLLSHIKFGQQVESVHPVVRKEGQPSWTVSSRDLESGNVTSTTCDALLVCNGHFAEPSEPVIEGMDLYKGRTLHSHDYRHPSPFTAATVVVLGAAASGLDIALELSSVASQVLLSHNYPVQLPTDLPPNIRQVTSVISASHDGFTFANGSHAQADAIIFCTGYKYSFPFLSDECEVSVKDNHVTPLYKHLIHIKYPSMGFIGIPSRVIVFTIIDYQIRYFLATVTGKVSLPSYENMMISIEEVEKEWKEKGLQEKHYHVMGTAQFQYLEDLAKEAGLEKPPSFHRKLLTIVLLRLLFSFPLFKSYTYSVTQDGSIMESRNGVVIHTNHNLTFLVIRKLIRLMWRDSARVVWLFGSIVVNKLKKVFSLA